VLVSCLVSLGAPPFRCRFKGDPIEEEVVVEEDAADEGGRGGAALEDFAEDDDDDDIIIITRFPRRSKSNVGHY